MRWYLLIGMLALGLSALASTSAVHPAPAAPVQTFSDVPPTHWAAAAVAKCAAYGIFIGVGDGKPAPAAYNPSAHTPFTDVPPTRW